MRSRERAAALAAVVRAQLEPLVDPGYRALLERVVPTEQAILGVRVPDLRACARAFALEHGLDLAAACATLDALCRAGSREEVLFGIELVARHRRAFTRALWPRVRAWLDWMTCWETCDQLAMNVGGELLVRDRGLADELIALAEAPGKWHRRFAISTASMLVRRGRADVATVRRVCAAFSAERDRDVKKALRSTLRQVGRREGEGPRR
jgi:3-methyladenine DNA glycosylase AlkD